MMNLSRAMTNCSTIAPGLAALAVVVAAPAAAFSQAASAPVPVPVQAVALPTLEQIPGVTVRYYDVTGNTIPLLRASIDAQRPKNTATGQSLAADSKWSIGTGVKRQTTGSACKIVGATANFKAEVIMPRMVNPQGVTVPAPVVTEWQRYVGALAQQQAAILHQAYSRLSEVERAVMASTCEGAGAAASAAIARITQAPPPAAVPVPTLVPAKRGK